MTVETLVARQLAHIDAALGVEIQPRRVAGLKALTLARAARMCARFHIGIARLTARRAPVGLY